MIFAIYLIYYPILLNDTLEKHPLCTSKPTKTSIFGGAKCLVNGVENHTKTDLVSFSICVDQDCTNAVQISDEYTFKYWLMIVFESIFGFAVGICAPIGCIVGYVVCVVGSKWYLRRIKENEKQVTVFTGDDGKLYITTV